MKPPAPTAASLQGWEIGDSRKCVALRQVGQALHMSEPKDTNVSHRLREQAQKLENLALDAESRSSFQLNGVEEEELGALVKFLRGQLDELRLANIQERLRDVDSVLRNLKADLTRREEDGRPTRVVQAMIWEAENERGRVMASMTHVVQTPTRYLSFHKSGEPQRFESLPGIHGFFRGLEHSYSAEALDLLEGRSEQFESPDSHLRHALSAERRVWDLDAASPYDNEIDHTVRRPQELVFQSRIGGSVEYQLRSASEQLGLPPDPDFAYHSWSDFEPEDLTVRPAYDPLASQEFRFDLGQFDDYQSEEDYESEELFHEIYESFEDSLEDDPELEGVGEYLDSFEEFYEDELDEDDYDSEEYESDEYVDDDELALLEAQIQSEYEELEALDDYDDFESEEYEEDFEEDEFEEIALDSGEDSPSVAAENEDFEAEVAALVDEFEDEELDELELEDELDELAELDELDVAEDDLEAELEALEVGEDEELAELEELDEDEDEEDELEELDLDEELAELEELDEDEDEEESAELEPEDEGDELEEELAELEELEEEDEELDLDEELAELEELDEDEDEEESAEIEPEDEEDEELDLDAELAELEELDEDEDEEESAEIEPEDEEDEELDLDAELAELELEEDEDEEESAEIEPEDEEDEELDLDAELAELEELEEDEGEEESAELESEDEEDEELDLDAELAELEELDEDEDEDLDGLDEELEELEELGEFDLDLEDEFEEDEEPQDELTGAPSAELLGPAGGELLGAPDTIDSPEVLFSGPAQADAIGDEFFAGPADAAPLGEVEFAQSEDAGEAEEFDEDDDFIEDLEPIDEPEEPELKAPTKEYRSQILEALRKVQSKDEAQARADVLSVLESAVPEELRQVVSERRRLVRLTCEYDVNCYQGNQIFHATIRDISLGGMKIEVSKQLQQGSQLEISNPHPTEGKPDKRVTAQVRWFRVNNSGQAEAGLQFVDPPEVLGRSWVVSLLNKVGMQSQVFNQRKYTRAVADFGVDIVDANDDVYEGRCVDLGLGGALVDSAPGFEEGDEVLFRCLSFGIHGRLEAKSKVVKIKEMTDDYGTYALEFYDLNAATTKLLGRYVVDLLKLGRTPRKRG